MVNGENMCYVATEHVLLQKIFFFLFSVKRLFYVCFELPPTGS